MTNMNKFSAAFLSGLLAAGLLAGCSAPASPDPDKASGANTAPSPNSLPPKQGTVELKETTIPSLEEGISLYLRNKHLSDKQTFRSKEVVLFLEPFSVPAAEAFDVPGYSWMEEYAKKGYDTWAMDFRGFGKSTRPAAMDTPPGENKPVVRAADCVKDLAAAVDYIKKTRNVEKINLVGWSYGSVVAGMYAADHPENVEKLVLYGFMHGFDLPSMAKTYEAKDKPGQVNPNMPAYQIIDFDNGMHHWHMMLNGRDLVSKEAMEAVRKVFVASDPTSASREKQAIRRPMGPLVDLYYTWSGRPLYDAGKIRVPVLVIRGDGDFFAEPGFLNKLTGTQNKKEVVIKDATHWVLYEKNRDKLLSETDTFLSGN